MARFAGLKEIKARISEQASVTGSLRGVWGSLRRSFWPGRPTYDRTKIHYDMARQLYRNDAADSNLGSGFCRPIIDLAVNFMGLPRAASGDDIADDYLNDCISNHWASELQQMIRNACRDSLTIVRIGRKNAKTNPLVTDEESEACFLEIVDPERVAIFYDERDNTVIDRAYITHRVEFIIEDRDRQTQRGTSAIPETREHNIVEEITRTEFRYWDETAGEWLDEWRMDNTWGFVPLREVFNEYDSTLSGGQSDLEGPYPFIRAFHDVMGQALAAHKYHSIPKVKFKILEIQSFLMNNFPDSFESDDMGQPVPGTFTGNISWKGSEIIFLQTEEDVEFLEAESVLSDSKLLLEFLLDCISIASETPEWAFMRVEGATSGQQTSSTLPFLKKMERKRKDYTADIQFICKMALAITHQKPIVVQLAWEEITVEQLVTRMQSLEQLIMALEVAAQRQLISDDTARATLRPFIPAMKAPEEEAKDAEDNFVLELTAPNAEGDPNQNGDKKKIPVLPRGGGGNNE